MNAAPIDVPRLIRIASLLFAILAGALVYFAYQPQIDGLQTRLDDAEAQLRSEEVAFTEMPRLRAERFALAERYDALFEQNPEAVFLRELASTVHRHDVRLVATSVTPDATAENGPAAAHPALFKQTGVSLELRGTYAHLLGAIGDLSRGSEIVGVDPPTLRRDGDAVVASVPVTIYEPSKNGNPP
jgi:Tfp pilus assembly protein PilO